MHLQYPFYELISNQTSLFVNKIPTIVVDSGFAWDSFLATIIGAMISGSIPAFIAWKTIKSNVETLRLQVKLSEKREHISTIRSQCAQFASEVEVMLAEFVLERKKISQSPDYLKEHWVEFSRRQFDLARKLNLLSSEVSIALNNNNEYANDIIIQMSSIRDICSAIINQTDVGNIGDDTSIYLKEPIINLLGAVKSYILKEQSL